MPLTDPTPAAAFPGEDADYLQRVRERWQLDGVQVDYEDAELVRLGREFCHIVSGGGLLADKVDAWGAIRQVVGDVSLGIFQGAFDVYCPELTEGYLRVRASSRDVTPTSGQRADLVRSVLSLQGFKGVTQERLPNGVLTRAAQDLCTLPDGRLPDDALKALPLGPGAANSLRAALAVTVAYCPEVSREYASALDDDNSP